MGLSEDLQEIKTLLVEQKETKKEKKFRIPFGKKVGKNQKRKNYVTLVLMGENNSLDFKKVQIQDQTFMEDSIPRLAGAGYVYYFKKNPFIFLPNWSVEPITNREEDKISLKAFSSKEDYEESLKDGRNTVGYRLLLNKMKLSAIESKKTMGSAIKWILGIGLAAVIGYALITGGG